MLKVALLVIEKEGNNVHHRRMDTLYYSPIGKYHAEVKHASEPKGWEHLSRETKLFPEDHT